MLLDGHSLAYRAFFALPTDLATASGQVTNAVYGFTSMLINLVRDHEPDSVAVSFDLPEPTFRHERIETYKANRESAPDIFRQQLGLVRQVVETLRIPIVEASGFEADDVIATLATVAEERGDDVIIVTGDRDTYQLVADPHIKVLYNKRGVSEYDLMDVEAIRAKTGVVPTDYVHYAALRGDNSDNLPGVPGVGEKTAAKLVNTYGDIDGIYAHIDEQTPKLRENLAANEEQVRANLEVMPLVRDLELGVELDDLRMGRPDPDEVRQLFDFLEFHSLQERLTEAIDLDLGPVAPGIQRLEVEVATIDSPEDAVAALTGASAPVALAGRWEGDELGGVAVCSADDASRASWIPAGLLEDAAVAEAMESLPAVAGHSTKELVRALLDVGIGLRNLVLDTQLAAYLLDPAEGKYVLDDLLVRYARLELPSEATAEAGQLDFDGESVDASLVAAREAAAVSALAGPIGEALDSHGLRSLNDEIEVPLVRVLAKMEHLGVGVDVGELKLLRDNLAAEAERLRAAVVADAGREFNVNSTKQLREVLFDELGLTPQKKTKTGFSTDHQTLEKMLGEHPIIEHLLAYREVEKLRSTYGEGLLAEVGPGDRIRATFNQTVARTGRLSSDKPNLHNIPVRTDTGRMFRKAFVPADGFELLVADYNQIELRCIAHLSDDPGLVAAFEAGEDIHRSSAARVFGVEPDDVTKQQREYAKMVSYGLAYGMEAYGLSQRLHSSVEEAQSILDAYFAAYPKVKEYMEATVAEARERGYTETLFGRRRQIPELSSPNYRIRQAGSGRR